MKTVLRMMTVAGALAGWAADAAPILECENAVFEFGTVENTELVKHTFVIKNAGDKPLEIRSIRPTCGCTITDTKPRTVAPGLSTQIPVTLNLKGRRGRQIKNIVVTSNDPKRSTMQLRFDGTATSVIDVQPVSISFGVLPEGVLPPGKFTRTISVSTTRDEPFEITKVLSSRQLVDTEIKVIEAGKKYEVKVTAKGEAKQGVFRETLNIQTTSKAMPNISVPVIATVRGQLTIIPNILQLSSAIKTPQTRYITVRGNSVADFTIQSAECTCSEQAKITVQNKGRYGWRIVVRDITANKSLNGEKIIIRTNVKGKEVIEIPINVLAPYTANRPRVSAPRIVIPAPNTGKPTDVRITPVPTAPIIPVPAPVPVIPSSVK